MTTTITLPSGAMLEIESQVHPSVGVRTIKYSRTGWTVFGAVATVAKIPALDGTWTAATVSFSALTRLSAIDIADLIVIIHNAEVAMLELDEQYAPGSKVE